MSTEPTTQAGRKMLAGWMADGRHIAYVNPDAILAIEAEARDASRLLREAMEQVVTLMSAARPAEGGRFWMLKWRDADRVLDLAEAALAAAPPEPRWPSRAELAIAIRDVWPEFERSDPDGGTPTTFGNTLARLILAALREGGERP